MRILASLILVTATAGFGYAEDVAPSPITVDEARAFGTILTKELFRTGQLDAFMMESQKAGTLEGQMAVMNKYAAILQARGVKFPHPVLADGSVPPLPVATSVVQDPESRAPTQLDPTWKVIFYEGEGKVVQSITKNVDRRIIRSYYDVAGFRKREESFPDNGNPDNGSGDPKDWLIDREWTQNQRLRSLTIGNRTYGLPAAVQPAHALYNARQVIVWNDPHDQNKGIRSATLLPATESEGSTAYVGTWIAWNEIAFETEHGEMLAGVRTGAWTERTFDAKAGADPTAEATGTYINGKKSGTWTIKLSDAHPDAVKAFEAAQKKGQVIMSFMIEQIYESGTVVQEKRSF